MKSQHFNTLALVLASTTLSGCIVEDIFKYAFAIFLIMLVWGFFG